MDGWMDGQIVGGPEEGWDGGTSGIPLQPSLPVHHHSRSDHRDNLFSSAPTHHHCLQPPPPHGAVCVYNSLEHSHLCLCPIVFATSG